MTTDLESFVASARTALKPLEQGGNVLWWALDRPGLISRTGTWVEFGVHGGSTLRGIAKKNGGAHLWGFDSFRGLPEDWNKGHKKGMYRLDNPIMPPEGVNLMVGWFSETLPFFNPPAPVTFVHVDCDLYSAASSVMKWLKGKSAPGCVVVFDDFFTEPHSNGVVRALFEAQADGLTFEWLSKNAGGDMVAIKLP